MPSFAKALGLIVVLLGLIANVDAFRFVNTKLSMATRLRSSETATAEVEKPWVGGKALSAKDKDVATIISNDEIAKILPHRYPFLLVDRVVEFEAGKRAVGIKCITANEPQFTGHFPGRPIMPGVLMIEAMAQLGKLLFVWIILEANAL